MCECGHALVNCVDTTEKLINVQHMFSHVLETFHLTRLLHNFLFTILLRI
jgi:hypothetical protein